jgi:hypothetical protein
LLLSRGFVTLVISALRTLIAALVHPFGLAIVISAVFTITAEHLACRTVALSL